MECRNCSECKKNGQIESISIQEEVEQSIIERSVYVNIQKGITVAKLPFISDPKVRLKPNEGMAFKVYQAQVRKLEKNPEDKIQVINSKKKLQELGFVDFVNNLSRKKE